MSWTVRLKPLLGAAVLLLSSTTLAQTPAPPTSGNPPGAQYIAALTSPLSGSVIASSSANGTGVDFQINVLGLPASGGPFLYYLTNSTNCTADPPVFDPYNAKSGSGCSNSSQEHCAVGDLWGKHGKMEGPNFDDQYTDLYLSTAQDAPAYLGDCSVVIQLSNKTNLACVSFSSNGSPVPSDSETSSAPASPPVAVAPEPQASAHQPSANPLAQMASANTLPFGPGPAMVSSSSGAMPGTAGV